MSTEPDGVHDHPALQARAPATEGIEDVRDRDGHPIVLGLSDTGTGTDRDSITLYCKLCETRIDKGSRGGAQNLSVHLRNSPGCRERLNDWLEARMDIEWGADS